MNYIDIAIIILLAWSAFQGFRKGLVKTVASLAALLLGIFGAIKFSGIVAGLLAKHTSMDSQLLPLIAFAVTFILIIILVHLVARVLNKIVESVSLGLVNKIVGAVFGALKTAFIISIVLVIFGKINEKTGILAEETINKSLLYKPVSQLSIKIFPYLNFKQIKDKMDIDVEDETEEQEAPAEKEEGTQKTDI